MRKHLLTISMLAIAALLAPVGGAAGARPGPAADVPDEGCSDGQRINPVGSYLMSVSADSASDAWAVGYEISDEQTLAYVAHWDGSTWTRVQTPSPDWGDFLCSVVAFAPDDVWVAGQRRVGKPGGIPRSLVMHWDGSTWTMVPIKDDQALAARKWGISGTSGKDVWVAGEVFHGEEGPSKVALEHWNGKIWRVVASPLPKAQQRGNFWAVDSFSRHSVFVVGGQQWTDQQVAQAWDGNTWSGVDCPTCGVAHLVAVSMDSASTAWAVGHGTGALIERWDGSTLAPVDGAEGPSGSALYGVAASSPSAAWAAGTASGKPLLERWDGTSWTIAHAAHRTGTLTDVDGASSTDVWAVGYHAGVTHTQPLLEHWDGSTWSRATIS